MNTGVPQGVLRDPRGPTRLPEAVKALLDAVDGPVLLRGEGHWLYANAALHQGVGADAQVAAHSVLADCMDLADERRLADYADAVVPAQAGAGRAVELRVRHAQGDWRRLAFRGRPWRHGGGDWVLLTGLDLGLCTPLPPAALDPGQLLHQLQQRDPVPTFVIDVQGRVAYWNTACERLTGVGASEMLGGTEPWRAFHAGPKAMLSQWVLAGDVGSRAAAILGPTLRRSPGDAEAWQFEAHFPRLGVGGRWLQATAAALRDEQGEVVGVVETLLDVGDRRRAEDHVQRQRADLEQRVADRTAELLVTHHELEAFMANAPVGIVATRGVRVVRSNRMFARMFDLPDNEPQAWRLRRLFPTAADFQGFVRLARDALAQGKSFVHDVRVRTVHGSDLWVQCMAYLADGLDGPARVWWLLQDRTGVMRAQRELVHNFRLLQQTNQRLAEAQNQLVQSEKMVSLGQLAAGLAHEINNPLGFVASNLVSLRRYALGLIRLLQAQDAGADPATLAALRHEADVDFVAQDLPDLLDQSDDGLARVKKIVQDLKDFSRVDQSDWQDADLNAGLDSTLNMVMHEVKYKARVDKQYGALPLVHCLAGQLNQVFMNLIVNAAQAIERDGLITLRTGTATVDGAAWAWVDVQDNGAGMSPEVQRRVFEPFFTTKPVGQGTGLGLSLSFSIVKKHGGRIELDSEAGRGTRFRVWVPVAGPPATEPQSAPA